MTVLLTLFALKRPDIGYHAGMNMLLCPLLNVFSSDTDAFIMFSHIIEEIYPKDFFTSKDRYLAAYSEYRVFAMMAESLRPRLVKSLKAVFTYKDKTQKSQESDYSPFVTTMKRLSEAWFSSLFTTYLEHSNWLRVMDVVLVYGFEGVMKVALGLISEAEAFIVAAVKQETKNIGQGSSIDALITAGNMTRLRLFHTPPPLHIERLLRKVLTKPKYTSIRRVNFLPSANLIEGNYLERVTRLRQTRSLVRKQGEVSVEGMCVTVINALGNEEFAREALVKVLTQNLNWTSFAALNFVTTLDQKGGNVVTYRQFQAGISLLTSENEPRHCLAMLFSVIFNSQDYIEPSDIIDIITCLESTIDLRSSFFQHQSDGLYSALQSEELLSIEVCLDLVLQDAGCRPLMDYIKAVQDESFVPTGDMRMVEVVEEVSFESIHSPIVSTDIPTPPSDLSEDYIDLVPEPEFFPQPRDEVDLTPPVITIQDMDIEVPHIQPQTVEVVKRPERQRCARLCGPQACCLS